MEPQVSKTSEINEIEEDARKKLRPFLRILFIDPSKQSGEAEITHEFVHELKQMTSLFLNIDVSTRNSRSFAYSFSVAYFCMRSTTRCLTFLREIPERVFLSAYFRNMHEDFAGPLLGYICRRKIALAKITGSENIAYIEMVVYKILSMIAKQNVNDSIVDRVHKALSYMSMLVFIQIRGKPYPFLESSAILKLARDSGFEIYYKSDWSVEKNDYYCYGKIYSQEGKLLHERTLYLSEFKSFIARSGSPWALYSTQMLSKRLIAFLVRDNADLMGLYDYSEKDEFETRTETPIIRKNVSLQTDNTQTLNK